jgi:hypothetical protein
MSALETVIALAMEKFEERLQEGTQWNRERLRGFVELCIDFHNYQGFRVVPSFR